MKIVSEISILRKKSEEVTSVEEAKSILEQLTKELAAQKTGIGLSAIQIGIPKRISILRNERGDFYPIINPEIVELSEEFEFMGEGCLSFPGVYLNTKRYKELVIKNKAIDGDTLREETHYFQYEDGKKHIDIECIAAQHEIDHLDGILFFDRESPKQMPIVVTQKVGRNDPCPCGSGKKYKKCCGLS